VSADPETIFAGTYTLPDEVLLTVTLAFAANDAPIEQAISNITAAKAIYRDLRLLDITLDSSKTGTNWGIEALTPTHRLILLVVAIFRPPGPITNNSAGAAYLRARPD
jgi:hypothetical protein